MCEKVLNHVISTSWGDVVVQTINGNVVKCLLPKLDDDPAIPLSIEISGNDAVSRYVLDVFHGRDPDPITTGELGGTPFQSAVWKALRSIPKGETRSYAEIASAIGHQRSCRAVANACGSNPIPLIIPCHRAIGADGSLGGFSSGVAWKRRLLAVEKQFAF